MIIINDVMAYMFGFFFGRTPLIKLSPKKTWEGYLGGGVATVLMGLLVRSRAIFRGQEDVKCDLVVSGCRVKVVSFFCRFVCVYWARFGVC